MSIEQLRTQIDARTRALRTLLQGLVVDVGVAVLMVLATALPGVQWTRVWWLALLGLLGKTACTAGSSWLHRRFGGTPPA
jgi:hypothetical protein